jgi:hypothetical protein
VKLLLKFSLGLLLAFAFTSPLFAADIMGQVAIYNERAGWIDAGTAQAQSKIFMDGVKLTKDIQVLGDADIAKWAEANLKDGDVDVIITFGDFPSKLYTPGNAQKDGSVVELFIEAGNMVLNTADYIFYVNQGAGSNGDTALKNITDSNFDMWTDGTVTEPTAEGKKYTPSLPAKITAPRCFKKSQIDANDEWDLEVAFAEGSGNCDPAIIRNNKYGGRVGILFQVADAGPPRGKVLIEIFDNWLKEKLKAKAVDPNSKLATTWARVKHD